MTAIEPYTEADSAAVLANLLVRFGNEVGPRPHLRAGHVRHPAKLNAVIAGDTSKARKGGARSAVDHIFDPHAMGGGAFSSFQGDVHRVFGLGSGEALVEAVSATRQALAAGGRCVLVVEPEFSRMITVMLRKGSTLSAILRQAWDGEALAVTTRQNPVRVEDAHVSVLAEITAEELARTLPVVELMNGFGNRFLWVWATRSKLLPDGGGVPDDIAVELRRRVGEAKQVALRLGLQNDGQLHRSTSATQRWEEIYEELSVPQSGVVGAATARAEAQILRLSLTYALLDSSPEVGVPHIEAAYAFWRYCEDTATYLFAERDIDEKKAKIEMVIREAGVDGLTRTELDGHFSSHLDRRKLAELIDRGSVVENKHRTTGRPRSVLIHAEYVGEAGDSTTPPGNSMGHT